MVRVRSSMTSFDLRKVNKAHSAWRENVFIAKQKIESM